MNQNDLDVIVIGGGQAGLAAGYTLAAAGLGYVILEAEDAVGGSWPKYYDSLTLFSPARFSALPGLPLAGDQERYPTRDELVAYLRGYADHFRLSVRTGAHVAATRWDGDRYVVTLAGGDQLTGRALIAATGGFGTPNIPALPAADVYGGRLMHVSEYRRPDTFAGTRTIVIGAGNSAVQVAVELTDVAHVSLATRNPVKFKNQRPFGHDLHHWLHWSGLDQLPLGRRVVGTTPVLDSGRYEAAVAAGRPDRRPMFERFTPDGVVWADGTEERVDAVILGTGYRPTLGYLPEQAFGADGWPAQRRGVSTTLPRLAYVGLPGQNGIASATVRGVGPDAGRVVRSLARDLRLERPPVIARPAAGYGFASIESRR